MLNLNWAALYRALDEQSDLDHVLTWLKYNRDATHDHHHDAIDRHHLKVLPKTLCAVNQLIVHIEIILQSIEAARQYIMLLM